MEDNNKIKVLFVPSDNTVGAQHGVGHFRSIWVSQTMEKYHKDEFQTEINTNPDMKDIAYLKQFDIIHFHRQLGPNEDEESNFKMLKDMGVTLIMDIDDYWEPFAGHPLYAIIKQEKYPERIKRTLARADAVTTTTNLFAEEIKKINKNVYVIPNAVDPEDKMWSSEALPPRDEKTCRIAWVGGSSHFNDLKLLDQSMTLLYNNDELKDRFQMILCGFDTRGTVTQIDEMGRTSTRPIKPNETVWNQFEHIFTNSYQGLSDDPEYVTYLKKITKKEECDVLQKRYVRRWTLPLTQYAKHYDYCDVCLAPLDIVDTIKTDKGQVINQENIFNKVKSELKVIEAGMKKKTLIAQDFAIYKEVLTDGENAILVDKNNKGWYQAMRKVILDKDYREMLAENLHNFVVEKYHIKNVTKDRVEIYKSILEKVKNPTLA